MGFRQMTYFSVIKEPLERLFFHYDFKSMETLKRHSKVIRINPGDTATFKIFRLYKVLSDAC